MDDSQKGSTDMDPRQLFGSVRRLPVIGNLPAPAAELLKPLPDTDYATHFFCTGCGTMLPVLKSAVSQIAGSELPDYHGQYIVVERCDLCNDAFIGAKFEKIPIS